MFAVFGEVEGLGAAIMRDPIIQSERRLQVIGVEVLKSRSGVRGAGHTGVIDGYLTAAFYSPERNATLVAHINRFAANVFNQILSRVFKAFAN